MQLTPEQLNKPLKGLTAKDALIGLQLVTRLLSFGGLKETEILPVGMYRSNLVDALKDATDVDYNMVIEAQILAAQREQQEQQQTAASPAAPAPASPPAPTVKEKKRR